jgi:hypothetical protein
MPKEIKVLPIKKVVAVLSVFWTIAGAILLLRMHYFARTLVMLFLLIIVVPVTVGWVLVFVSLHLEEQTKSLAKNRARRKGTVGRTGKGILPTSKGS